MDATHSTAPRVSYAEIFRLFFWLGATGFGGPIALIALMEQECSHRRQWVSLDEFNRSYLFCKLLPGPVAYQMSLWMGYHLRGRFGGLCAGVALLLPSAVLILLLTIFYQAIAGWRGFGDFMEGLRCGALVVIFDSIVRLMKPFRSSALAWTFIVAGAGLFLLLPRFEPLIIIGGGLATLIYDRVRSSKGLASCAIPVWGLLFWTHFKAGAFVFGTGLAVIPFLQHEAVGHYHWLTTAEFLDGIAFGQVTPGPVTITSVFIGFRAGGFPGAGAALAGMYTPGLIFVLFLLPWLRRRLESSSWLNAFQRGALPMVIGCIAGASLLLCRESLTGWTSWGIVAVLGLLLWQTRLPAWTLIPIGGAFSGLFHWLGGT